MSLNLTEVLQPKARAFVKAHEDTLNAMLEPELFDAGLRMARFGGPAARDLVHRFARAQQAWEKFVWMRLAQHWVNEELGLEESIELVNEDVLDLVERIETQTHAAYRAA